MNPQTYPGKGLTPSQLLFALNEELKRTIYSSSFTSQQVSQLHLDALTALAAICEWKNSFTRINRIPLDVLALIPTHLLFQRDRLRASFVCRHWRRTFLHRAELWSELFLSKGETYTNTLLGRVKGSPLDVIVGLKVPPCAARPLSAHIKQTRSLFFTQSNLANIQEFLEVNPEPLPLLHTLEITLRTDGDKSESSGALPFPPSFSKATNLKAFYLDSDSDWSPPLGPLAFPNLTSLDLSVNPVEKFQVSQLLDFLETSPLLRTVKIEIIAGISLEGVPQERVVVLPNVKDFNLIVTWGGPVYEIGAHVSCPFASSTSFTNTGDVDYDIPEDIFPPSTLLNSIVQQYTRSPVEEVTLGIRLTSNLIKSQIAFRSSDESVVKLRYEVFTDCEVDEFEEPHYTVCEKIFGGAIRLIGNHPQLTNIKRLHICPSPHGEVLKTMNELARFFKSLGPLDKLTLHFSYLARYNDSFALRDPAYKPVLFPSIKNLTISRPVGSNSAVVTLAKSQHKLGIPFERVTYHNTFGLEGMEKELRPWVGSVECRQSRDDDEVSRIFDD